MSASISPLLLASAGRRPQPRRVGVAVTAGAAGLAWAVTAETEPVVADRWTGPPMEAVVHALSVAIGVFGGVPTDVQLVMDDAAAALAVRDRLAGLTWLTIYAQTGRLGHDAHDTARALVSPVPPVEPAAPSPKVTVVATDGSCSRRAMGMAWVTADGRHGAVASKAGQRSPLVAELRAVRLALREVAGHRVHLLVDSRQAITLVRNARKGVVDNRLDGGAYQLVSSLVPMLAHRHVTTSWVRGHAGHPLNETADRLAVAARRAHELGQSDAVRADVFTNIMIDLGRYAA